MRFRPGARLDTSEVVDRRGRGTGLALGGGGLGGLGLIIYLAVALLSGGSSSALQGLDSLTVAQQPPSEALGTSCRTGADANTQRECRIVADIDSIQSYWSKQLSGYTLAKTVFFSGATPTGCGQASTDVGPFYCPVDKQVYIDLGFLDELHSRFGATVGPLSEAYVLAHEYGHHVQDLTGDLKRIGNDQQGASSGSVRAELQADCYAGVWAKNAEQTGYITGITQADVHDALSAAASVGDDRIQSESQGQVNPESWTHGSSAEREHWFSAGFASGQPKRCDTWSASSLASG